MELILIQILINLKFYIYTNYIYIKMIESIKTFLLLSLIIYSIFVSVLYCREVSHKNEFFQDKLFSIKEKTNELDMREKKVGDKEKCMRNLTRVKTINKSIYELLKNNLKDED